jgi:agmatinase
MSWDIGFRLEGSISSFSGVSHAGIASFLKSRICPPETEALRNCGAKAAVIGFPFDGTCVSRTGTGYGPRSLRDISCQFISYHPQYDIDVMNYYHLVDCGDIPVVPGNARKSLERGADLIAEILRAQCIPVLLGGEHLVSLSGTTAASRVYDQKIGLLVYDCHLDTASDVDGELLNHCCPWSRTLELPHFDGRNIAIIGIGTQNPKEERAIADKHGVNVYTIDEVAERGVDEVTEDAIKVVKNGTSKTYVSVDIDAIDAAYAPGTGAPTPGGLTSREILRSIKKVGLAGFDLLDLVEVAPQYDHGGITAVLGCRIILDALAANTQTVE